MTMWVQAIVAMVGWLLWLGGTPARAKVIWPAVNNSPTSFTVDTLNQLTGGPTSPYTYDANGNETANANYKGVIKGSVPNGA